MRNSLVILICVISLNVLAQKPVAINKKELEKTWVIDSGAFPMNTVKLRAFAEKDTAGMYTGYAFADSSKIIYIFHVPYGVGVCGNGMNMVKKSKWTLKGNTLRIYFKGGYFGAGTYEYDILYTIVQITDNNLILKKKKTYKDYKCETCFR